MDKVRKNLLGRTVLVKRKAMSDGSIAKTRTVKSKSGGTISSKTSYKDADSLAGKMRANKITKIAQPRLKSSDKKVGMADAVKGSRRKLVKMNAVRTELSNRPYRYDLGKLEKPVKAERVRRVERLMRKELNRGTRSF